MLLHDEERIDYIFRNRLKIIQSRERLAFSIDSILLGQFVSVKKTRGTMVDLCSGNGVIPLVMSERSTVPITGIEIQPDVVEMAKKSMRLNNRKDQIQMHCGDLKEAPEAFGRASFDVVTCNPPYYHSSLTNQNERLTLARHETELTIYDIAQVASALLKDKGKTAFVFRPERIHDLFEACTRANLEPKRLQFVHPKAGVQANIVLLEASKGGKRGLTVQEPIFVYGEDGKHTDAFQRSYNGQQVTYERRVNEKEQTDHYVYMIQCVDNTLYTGYARNVWERLRLHESGKGAKYTRGRGPFTLVHMEGFETKREALQEEWRLKQLSRVEKLQYIKERRRGVYANGHIIPGSYTDWQS
ncbi:GIY-YIG nuclease family protein [Geomicrobium sediminis]|uniref:tRNA1(Val) A37 N6-methylase TrmN6 n=1 Tax=Geomicrobium sediminis TaxID=1347788 RepID=A0ABS2PI71_9BACL|nr:GIY-YIG nuclease family protein [Geomicrobium sediminis]MBM7635133.1 tRNA1(Val) A37 N6-methylase TrmN6 [Geomicrobium sediminis]